MQAIDEDTVVNRVKNGLYVALQDHFNNVNIKLKKNLYKIMMIW